MREIMPKKGHSVFIPPGSRVTYTWVCTNHQPYFNDPREVWELRRLIHECKRGQAFHVVDFVVQNDRFSLTCDIADVEAFFTFKHRVVSRFGAAFNRRNNKSGAVFLCTVKVKIHERCGVA